VEDLAKLSDEALAQLAGADAAHSQAGDAASVLFARYQKRVYIWCYRYVHEHEQALDLAQEAMLSAYRKLATFSGKGRFESWIFAITRNRCLTAVRKRVLTRAEDIIIEELADPGGGPDRHMEEKLDESAFLVLVHGCLDPTEQEALYLRCFEHLPVDEITELLDIKDASGARGLLQKARRKLRAASAKPDRRPPRPAYPDAEAN
jgi:RNA polymerase sigma-70 factor (ECF subfamily)